MRLQIFFTYTLTLFLFLLAWLGIEYWYIETLNKNFYYAKSNSHYSQIMYRIGIRFRFKVLLCNVIAHSEISFDVRSPSYPEFFINVASWNIEACELKVCWTSDVSGIHNERVWDLKDAASSLYTSQVLWNTKWPIRAILSVIHNRVQTCIWPCHYWILYWYAITILNRIKISSMWLIFSDLFDLRWFLKV